MKKMESTIVTILGRGAFLLGCVLAFGSPCATVQAQHSHPPRQNAAPQIGAAATPFELKTLDGKPISLTTSVASHW